MSDKHSFFLKLIRGIEGEAQRSEAAANIACDRVNSIRSRSMLLFFEIFVIRVSYKESSTSITVNRFAPASSVMKKF